MTIGKGMERQRMRLTKREHEIFEFIADYIEANQYAPTLQEIADYFGLSSLATVHKHLKNLESKGAVDRDWNRARGMEVHRPEGHDVAVHGAEIPLLGLVAAGYPIEANLENETIAIPEEMLGRKRTFALRASGWSMIDEGIRDGDILVVEARETAEAGQTVVALLANVKNPGATVKKFYRQGNRIRLQPANDSMDPLYYDACDVTIQGILTGMLRRYS